MKLRHSILLPMSFFGSIPRLLTCLNHSMEHMLGNLPDVRLWQSLPQSMSHLIQGGICFSWFNTTVSMASIVGTVLSMHTASVYFCRIFPILQSLDKPHSQFISCQTLPQGQTTTELKTPSPVNITMHNHTRQHMDPLGHTSTYTYTQRDNTWTHPDPQDTHWDTP